MKRAMVIVLTMLNALLFIGTIVCAAWTYRNNKIINSANSIFAYREERGEVLFVLKDAEEVRLRFDENSVKIVQSYAHDGAENIFRMVLFVREYAREKGYEIERAVTEMYGEIRLHNILYRLRYHEILFGGYNRAQTIPVGGQGGVLESERTCEHGTYYERKNADLVFVRSQQLYAAAFGRRYPFDDERERH